MIKGVIESMKNVEKPKKGTNEKAKKFIISSNEGYIDFEGTPSDNISDSEYYLEFDDEKKAKDWIAEQKKKYDNAWSDSLKIEDGAWRYEDPIKAAGFNTRKDFPLSAL